MSLYITASIVLYKNDDDVLKTIQCVLDSPLNIGLFLIDNSPSDILKEKLKEILENKRVHYYYNNANIGFGAAHNIAIKKILETSKYHLVLNPDVTFEPYIIPGLIDYMEEKPNVGLVLPKIIYPSGEIQYACRLLPSSFDLIFKRFLPSSWIKRRMELYQLKFTGYNKEMEVPYLSGCFMFLRVEALKKVGLFDERFFMYPEDIDLTRRVHQQYKTMFYPGVQIVHAHEQGSYKNIKLFYIHITNMIKYFNKWGWFFDKEREAVNKKILSQFN